MFYMMKNQSSTHGYNLKSNVFDKMLADEMFSIKQRFFEKDLAYTSTVQRMTKSIVATPTLEVKQKWPVVDLFTRPLITEDVSDDEAKPSENYKMNFKNNLIKNYPKIKSLDVRSLSTRNPAIKCNCANSNANHQCKRGADCTRIVSHGTAVSTYPQIYMPYQAYFMSDYNENLFQNTHYHPKVINDLKIPKTTRRRKPTTPLDDYLYYDDHNKKRKPSKGNGEIIMNIDYDVEDAKEPEFAQDSLNEDLNEVFSQVVKRKCYCASSQATSHTSAIFITLLMCLSEIFGLELLLWKYKVIF